MDYRQRNFVALSKAIFVLSFHYENISLPIRESFNYDLIIEKNYKLFSVKVIATSSKAPSGTYVATLRGATKNFTKPFDCKGCDFVFVETPESVYLIPSSEITNKRAVSVSMYRDFVLSIPS